MRAAVHASGRRRTSAAPGNVPGHRHAGRVTDRTTDMSATTLRPSAAPLAAPAFGGPILAKYNSVGGAGGFLGAAQTGDTVCPDRVGHFVHFAFGSIYWTPTTGAHEVHGNIHAKWASLGWERCPFLGYPVTDESGCPDGVGRFNHFQSGSIYWTPKTGAFSVHGDIRAKWSSLGWEKSALGYPITDETGCPDGVGRFSHFQFGSIYWTPAGGAFEVHGNIHAKWASLGWEKGSLGYPTSDEGDLAGGGRVSNFQHGRICWTQAKGAWVETGAPGVAQLDYNFSPIVFDNGVPVGGFAHLTIRQDGSYVFSGHFHDSGGTAYSTQLAWALKDTKGRAYSFAHTGSVAGTFESGSRDDDWNTPGVNPSIKANWADLLGASSNAKASANLDIAALGSAVITALGDVVKVIGVVGQAFAGGSDPGAGGDDGSE